MKEENECETLDKTGFVINYSRLLFLLFRNMTFMQVVFSVFNNLLVIVENYRRTSLLYLFCFSNHNCACALAATRFALRFN